ncbi:hypothetical protein E1287_37130 [Actinomadura sp. KC06]|uniref:hypothetical protein n=1 Tax=Actinomadura sp. KC06 TaxID=2530369 RepID=UPI0010469CEA|nr:hypothetical protein [Actinomadura sp. KC06]TDD25585.1 hypothetical protein E1287_37130 [Actinomadura sp. KC06]
MALPDVAELQADWLNRDGRYGWMPLFLLYRTVYRSLVLHGIGLSFLLLQLGVNNLPELSILVMMWLVAVPVYALIPYRIYRREEETMRESRVRYLEQVLAVRGWDVDREPDRFQQIALEIGRARSMTLHPMGLAPYRASPFLAAVLLPVVLTLAQIIFS